MSNDIFKQMGVTVGDVTEKSLINIKKPEVEIKKSQEDGSSGRMGLQGNARERLERSFGGSYGRDGELKKAYGDENLKNTHGENWHKDNDKRVEKEVTTAVVADTHEGGEHKKKKKKESFTISASANAIATPELSEKSEKKEVDLFSKVFADKYPAVKKGEPFEKTPEDEKPTPTDSQVEAQQEKEDMAEGDETETEKSFVKVGTTEDGEDLYVVMKGGVGSGRKGHRRGETWQQRQARIDAENERTRKEDDKYLERKRQAKRDEESNARITAERSKKSFNVLDDLVKACKDKPSKKEIEAISKLHENSPEVQEQKIKRSMPKFVKAMGEGGLIMDFGNTKHWTAKTFEKTLNESGVDKTQEAIAKSQQRSYDIALESYVKKGDQKFNDDINNNGQPTVVDQLNKSFDQQTVEALKSGEINVENNMVSAPNAPRPNFDSSMTVKVGGEVAKAHSETDEGVLKLMKNMIEAGQDDGGMVADLTGSSGGMVDMTKGVIYNPQGEIAGVREGSDVQVPVAEATPTPQATIETTQSQENSQAVTLTADSL